MGKEYRLSFGRGDLIAIALVVLIAVGTAACFVPRSSAAEAKTVQIFQDGTLEMELPLDMDRKFTIGGEYENEIEIANGAVAIVRSNCPGTDCVHTGRITQAGRSIVCLPNRVEIRITGESAVDFTVR